jgi:5-methylcytosine-specific restriction protein A
MASFPPQTRVLAYARADQRCELCGVYAYGGSLHHRRPRGMGGDKRPETSAVSNALLLCGSGTTGCHGRIESNRNWARDEGLLVRPNDNPAEVPVVLRMGRVLLTDWGGYVHADPA